MSASEGWLLVPAREREAQEADTDAATGVGATRHAASLATGSALLNIAWCRLEQLTLSSVRVHGQQQQL